MKVGDVWKNRKSEHRVVSVIRQHYPYPIYAQVIDLETGAIDEATGVDLTADGKYHLEGRWRHWADLVEFVRHIPLEARKVRG